MIDRGPWSVKGIDQRARAVARDAARLEGVTLGEYLNNLILADTDDDIQHNEIKRPGEGGASSTLDQLARRVEAVEARSTLAITGIDQSVMGLVARLQKAEDNNTVIAGHVDTFIEELRETHAALSDKVRRLEEDDGNERSLEALKSLEEALGKLATHVYEEGEQAQLEADAIKGRVESGFMDVTERVERVEARVETTLTEAAKRVEEAVEKAELQAQAETRKLAEQVEAQSQETETRLSRVEDDVQGAIGSMEQTLLRIQERLNRAETTTDAALKGLEATFSELDDKVASISAVAGPEATARLRVELDARFEGLAEELKAEIEQSRAAMAQEIAEAGVADVSTQVEEIGDKVSRISESFHKRLVEVEAREMGVETGAIDRVSDEVGKLAERLEARVAESENASARAIEEIGTQVSTVAQRLQGRQDEAFGRLSAHVEETRSAQEARLSEALANMSDRFEKIHADATADKLSPVQKAIASLADRLEVLEAQDAPGKPLAAAPHAAEREDEDMLAAFSAAVSSIEAGVEKAELPKAVGDNDGFTPGLPEWAAPQDTDADEDYTPGLPAEVIEPKGKQASADPLAELGQWGTPELQGNESEDTDGTIFDSVLPGRKPEERITIPPAHLDLDVDMPRAALSPSAAEKAGEPKAAQPQPQTETPSGELEEDLDASDYIARARKAALAAAQGQASEDSAASSRLGGRVPLYAAASVIVLAAAGTSGYLYLRGKQSPAGPVSAAVTTPATPTVTAGGAGGGTPPTLNAATSGTGDAAAGLAAVAAAAGLEAPGTDITGAVESAPSDTVESVATGALPEPTMTAPQPAITPEPEPQPVALPERANFDPIPAPLTLQSAADSGDRVAAYQLGVRKLDSADYAEGARYISASAQKGLPIAQYRLSKLHEKGLGVPRDLAASRRWTERAASGGNVRAMHDLAVFYADGEGGEQSYAKSVEWFSKAAEFGVLDSQYNLAVLYQQGLGITKDLNEALFWFSVAAENGDPGAADQVRAMLTEVDADTALSVRARVQGWRGARPNGPANGEFGRQAWEGGGADRVRAVQTALNALGYDVGTPDGVFGPATQDAIRAYQRDASIPQTGTLSSALIESLNARANGAST